MEPLSRPVLLGAAAATLLFAVATVASADDGAWSSGAVTGEYLFDTGEEASAFDARLEVDAGIGPLTVGAVYRAYQLSMPAYNPAGVNIPESEIKHRYAALDRDNLRLRVGHFYSTFGRGLALRSFEDVDLEYDTVLDGLIGDYSFSGADLTALAGTVDEPLSDTRYRRHNVRAIRATRSVTSWLDIAGSVVERASVKEDDDPLVTESLGRSEDLLLGGEVNAWLGPVSVAAEYVDRQGDDGELEIDDIEGHATYVAATVQLPWATLFGEYKDYDRFQHFLVNPPTAVREHLWTLMNRATYEPKLDDERGYLVEATVPLGESLTVLGGASEARNHDADLAHWEMFGQADAWVGDTSLSAGAAWSREYELGKFIEHRTAGAEVILPLPSGQPIELQVQAGETTDITETVSLDYLVAMTVYTASGITLASVVEGTDDESEDRSVWAMFEVKSLLADDLELGVSVGSERGGLKCSGGVCRVEPEFSGARVRLTTYF